MASFLSHLHHNHHHQHRQHDSEPDSSPPAHESSCSNLALIRSASWHHHHRAPRRKAPPPDVPKGSLAVYVGDREEEQRRFVIPISYLNHPLFLELLKKSEEEFGFCHDGAMHLPCNVAVFCTVLKKIEDENLMHHVKFPRGPIGLTVL